jgi:hypothetical protein
MGKLESIATTLKYTWSLYHEYKQLKSSDDQDEKDLASLLMQSLVKFLADYNQDSSS